MRYLTLFALVVCSLWRVGSAAAQPRVPAGGIVNAASYLPAALPNGGIARGSLFVVFGEGLGPESLAMADFPLPVELAGVSIEVTAAGQIHRAWMIYAWAGQIAAVLPSAVPAGEASAVVIVHGERSDPVTVRVVESAFGILTRNQAGSGPAIVQNVLAGSDWPVNGFTDAANPGQVAVIWGTGLGAVAGDESAGALPGNLDVEVEVSVGDRPAQVVYRGRSGCCAGVDEVHILVPDDIAGCWVPLRIRAGGVVSNWTTMAIAQAGNVCSDPHGYDARELSRLLGGGQPRVGHLELVRRETSFGAPPELRPLTLVGSSAEARFHLWQPWEFLAALPPVAITPAGSCYAFMTADGSRRAANPPNLQPVALDAGNAVNVRGPRGTRQLARQADGTYFAMLGTEQQPDYLVPGRYAVAAPGAVDVQPFETSIDIPGLVEWTGRSEFGEIDRGRGVRVTWRVPERVGEFVEISGYSLSQDDGIGAGFSCSMEPGSGYFDIPAEILGMLPASGIDSLGIPLGALEVSAVSTPNRLEHPDLDVLTITYRTAHQRVVRYR